jgi:hypothetical protein
MTHPSRSGPETRGPARPGRGPAGFLAVLVILVVAGGGVAAWWFWPRLMDEVADSDWQEFRPPDGRCSVLMPGQPVGSSIDVNGVAGTRFALERARGKHLFAIAWADVPNVQFNLQKVVNARRQLAEQSFPGWKIDANMGAPPVSGSGGEGASGQEFTTAPLDTRLDTPHYTERVYVVPSRDAETMRVYILAVKDTPSTKWHLKFFHSLSLEAE